MSWFKVDDFLPDHRKVRKLGADRLAAMGLWTLCGAWASRATGGFVPDEEVTRYDPEHCYAARLVEVGLWARAEDDGETGYSYHDWDDFQPSREQQEKKREDTRRRVQAWRGRKRSDQAKQDATVGAQPASTNDTLESNAVGNALPVDDGNVSGNAAPDPSRTRTPPVETSEERSPSGGGVGEEASRKRSADPKPDPKGHRLPEDWWPSEADRDWFREKCPDLEGKGTALTEEFRDYWHSRAGKEARKTDWSKTWRNRMREKQDRVHNQKPPRDVRVPRVSASDSAAAVAQSLRRTPRESPSEPPQQPQLRLAAGGL